MLYKVLLCFLPTLVVGFPDGAPVDACVKERPNTPYHGQLLPQAVHTSPYTVVASSSKYQPGSNITVTIEGALFRGFFMQARDLDTHAWLGSWGAPNTKEVPECSAITHGDNKDKLQATLVWTAPKNVKPGRVYFTGSIVKDYANFWAEVVATEKHFV